MNHTPALDEADGKGGVREAINRNPVLFGGGVAGVLVLLAVWQFRPERGPRAFYTVDDGKTFFPARLQAPPFEYGGRTAVRAMVYSCDGGQTKFVGYLMRFTPEGKAAADRALSDRKWRGGPLGGQEVKRPGDAQWVAAGGPGRPAAPGAGKKTPAYAEVLDVRCPDGRNDAVLVEPD